MSEQTRIEEASAAKPAKAAILYRMVMPHHVRPYGLKAKALLERCGYAVEDRWLTTREETDRFKAEHGVKTTPQAIIDDARIGGYDELRRYFGLKVADPEATSYVPVIAVFAAAAALALAARTATLGRPLTVMAAEWFVSCSMVLLAMLKLQDVERFSTMFINYDLLAMRWVPYGYITRSQSSSRAR